MSFFGINKSQSSIPTLNEAIQNGNFKAVDTLLKLDPKITQEEKDYALYYAIDKNNPAIMALLLEKGADVNAKDGYNGTPLHYAAMERYTEIAAVILAVSPEAASAENNGGTAIDLSRLVGLDAAIVRAAASPAVAAAAARRRMSAMAALLKARQSRRGGKRKITKRATWRRRRHSRRR